MNEEDRNTVQAAIAVLDKHLKKPGFLCENPKAVIKYLRAMLQTEVREVFFVMFLDSQKRLIEGLSMFVGDLTSVPVYTREIARKAIDLNAHSVIVAHNHPSGKPTPSYEDKKMTRKIRGALDLIDVNLTDHVIIAGARHCSFVERRLISGLPPRRPIR